MAVAAQVASWGRRWPRAGVGPLGLQAGIPPVTFGDGQTLLGVKVEILINGSWVDVSPYVLYQQKIGITRGKGNEQIEAQPARCNLTLDNADRRFSPRNQTGPYFGYLTRNVKLRVTVNPGSNEYRRFTGRVSEWPPTWTTGDDRRVRVEANGVLRRLQQGNAALQSALERTTLRSDPIALWRMNDPSTASELSEAIGGGSSMSRITSIDLDSVSGPDGTTGSFPQLMPVSPSALSANGLRATVIADSTTTWTLDFIAFGFSGPAATTPVIPLTWNSALMLWNVQITSSGFQVVLSGTPTTGSGATIFLSPIVDVSSGWHHYRVTAQPSGGSLIAKLYVDGVLASSDTQTGAAGKLTAVYPQVQGSTEDVDSVSMGYLTLYAGLTGPSTSGSATSGFTGETATARLARLCTEEGVDYVISELVNETETMGPQTTNTLLNLLRECADVAEGGLDEDLNDNLRLLSRTARYNQAAMLVLDYSAVLLDDGVFEPTDDDRYTRNDWTITRPDSQSPGQYIKTSGTLNISDPEDDPQGVGRYDDSATLNVETDTQALEHAAYRVSKGTVDQVRIRSLPLWLERDDNLIPAWSARDPVDGRVLLLNTPSDIGTDVVDQVIEGYTEIIDQFTWHVVATTSPNNVNITGVADIFGVADCNGSTLSVAPDSVTTTLDLAITDNCTWVHTSGDYNIIVAGEVMAVTAVGAVGGAYPAQSQQLTVTRSVNGIVKSHVLGTQVHVYDPFLPIL